MPKKDALLQKIQRKPKNFTKRELDTLMKQCGCQKFPGGRGSSIGYYHTDTGRILQFDGPHPGNELYDYHVRKVVKYLKDIGEIKE